MRAGIIGVFISAVWALSQLLDRLFFEHGFLCFLYLFHKFLDLLYMRPTYLKDKDKKIIDLLVYFKYYLTDKDFKDMMGEFQKMLLKLQSEVSMNAFDNVRGKMGIKNLNDLETLKNLPKSKTLYHKFEKY